MRTRTPFWPALLLMALLLALAAPMSGASDDATATRGDATSLLDLEAQRLGGEVESLDSYRGQVLLVVNTASRCGYTSQYAGLQSLYERYHERGFSVLGFPSNDFGNQEPGSDAEIGAFCKKNYGVGFPMFSKVKVNGGAAHPVYVFLTSRPEPVGGPVRWNFEKYLVDREGNVLARYPSSVSPDDPKLRQQIERLLGAEEDGRS